MALLVAIEGADGVGKNTAARRLCEDLAAAGSRATLIGFPRYGETVAGVTIGRFLAGDLEPRPTPQTAAVLYALDRLEWRPAILAAAETNDVIVFDRYIASNMAYQAAKLPAAEARAMMEWILALEIGQFRLPPPALSIYLDTPWEMAREMILKKAQRSYTDRGYDEHEADAALQLRVRANYEAMAADDLLGPWRVVRASAGNEMRAPEVISAEILAHIAGLSG